MDLATGRAATDIIDLCCEVEICPEVAMPRGMKQPTRKKEQCFKVIDTVLLSSSDFSSRSDASVEDESTRAQLTQRLEEVESISDEQALSLAAAGTHPLGATGVVHDRVRARTSS